MKLPLHSEDLIKELDKTFPERCPEPSTPERQIWIYTGKRMIVRMLKDLINKQEEEEEEED